MEVFRIGGTFLLKNGGLGRSARAAYWLGLLAIFLLLRVKTSPTLLNVDELIPLKVSEAMSARGALDPNWRLADLPDPFRYDQYNFYLYSLVSHGVIRFAQWRGWHELVALRLANILFQLLAVAFALDAMRRIGLSRLGLAVLGAMLVAAPGLVQDAGMARPESLLYGLCALFIWTLTLPLPERRRLLLAGVVLGAGAAVKLTFLSLAVVLLPHFLSRPKQAFRALVTGTVWLALGGALGFAAAAPYAVLHFDAFLHGVEKLSAQYSGGHPPHSLPAYSLRAQLFWILRYFVELYCLASLAPLAAPFLSKSPLRRWAIGFALAWGTLVAYFATKRVFFERNLAHGLIPLLLVAVLVLSRLERPRWVIAGAVLLWVPMAFWSIQIARMPRRPERVAQFEAIHVTGSVRHISFEDVFRGIEPSACETIAVRSFNDPWSVSFVAELEREGFAPLARYRSPFGGLVTSTLQVYLDGDVHYFRCP